MFRPCRIGFLGGWVVLTGISGCSHTQQSEIGEHQQLQVSAAGSGEDYQATDGSAEYDTKDQVGFFTFTNHSPGPRTIGRGRYPRNHMLQYKSVTSDDVPTGLAIRAMLDDPGAYIGSPLFNTFMAELTQDDYPGKKAPLTEVFRRQLGAKTVATAANWAEAAQISKQLLNESFEYVDTIGKLKPRYIDSKADSYLQDQSEIVLTNIIMALELDQAERVLLVKDNSVRALDTNYWNKINYKKWFLDRRFLGSFVFPGYLEPIDTVGYEIREGELDRGVRPIKLGFYEVVYNQQSYVLVASGSQASGRQSDCIQLEPTSKVFFHCKLVSRPRRPLTPLITKERVAFHGILHTCQDNDECGVPTAISSGLLKTTEPLQQSQISEWEDIPLSSGRIHYHPL